MSEKQIRAVLDLAKRRGVVPSNVVTLSGGKFVTSPENEPQVPTLDLNWPLAHIAQALGILAGGANFFRQGGLFVTVDEETGDVRPMGASRFCSWLESVAWPFRNVENKRTGDWAPRYSRLGKDSAQVILDADEFRKGVRELRGVHSVRLPAWVGDGAERRPELLEPGYDPATGIFTVDEIPFAEMGVTAARIALDDLLAGYPWASETSKAVQVAAIVSPFVRLLLPPGAKRLMIIHNGNQPGTGKSTLPRMALAGVYGGAVVKSVDRDPAELRKQLDTAAIERKPFLFLDNLTSLRSPELNAFVTSGRWSARVLGKSQTEEMTVEAQVFVNGNQLDVGRELARRAAVCDLFLPGDPLERKFAHEITDEWLLKPETRSLLLSISWTAVQNWVAKGMPIDPKAKRPSFEAYTELVGSIVSAFGFPAPFEAAAIAADSETEATKALLREAARLVIAEGGSSKVFTNTDLRELAEGLALLDAIVPFKKDQAKALGHQLKQWKGRVLSDGKGRLFEFGKRKGGEGALYELTILPPGYQP